VSSGTAQGYLRWLQEVDLVVEQDGGHYYADPVLRFWVARSVLGLEIAGAPRPALLAELVAHLDEQYQQAATDLGVAKESQVRELLTGFAGQVVDGKLLGLAGKVRLPPFERVASYRSADGQVEVDALAEGEQRWAVEVRWRARLALPRDLRRLQAVAADLDARPWFIAKAGFTTAAQDLARQAGVMCSDQHDVEQLIRIVGRAGDERRKRGVGA
ncbi:MAG: restriction endonuclease, partial [Chloroflexi bacterium]|nr:restriction endonuclease [Chloroflexota bacterium]